MSIQHVAAQLRALRDRDAEELAGANVATEADRTEARARVRGYEDVLEGMARLQHEYPGDEERVIGELRERILCSREAAWLGVAWDDCSENWGRYTAMGKALSIIGREPEPGPQAPRPALSLIHSSGTRDGRVNPPRGRRPRLRAGSPPCTQRHDPRWHWGELRQAIGGRVTSEDFRRSVDELLADGLIVEVYEATGDWRDHRHLLALPERWAEYQWGDLVEVRVREDILGRLNGAVYELGASVSPRGEG